MSRLLPYIQTETFFQELFTQYHHVDNFYPTVKRKKGQSISIVVKIGNKATTTMYPSQHCGIYILEFFFYSVVGGLAANSQYKTSKEPTSRASVAHVVKKRETRYDKEKARLKVVLFCRSLLLLLPSFEVGKNFKRLLCSSSSPFFAIMPRQQSAAAFMKSFQSS